MFDMCSKQSEWEYDEHIYRKDQFSCGDGNVFIGQISLMAKINVKTHAS